MKKFIILSTFFFSISVHALPNCPPPSVIWDNCFGTYTYGSGDFEGDVYEGEWKDNLKHGQGTYTWSNGIKYVGEWKNDLRNGQGTQTFPRGDKYVGEFKDGRWHGRGTYTFDDGSSRDGYFMKDKGDLEAAKNHLQIYINLL